MDGDERTAFSTARIFLANNGYGVEYEKIDAVRVMENAADGRSTESELAS